MTSVLPASGVVAKPSSGLLRALRRAALPGAAVLILAVLVHAEHRALGASLRALLRLDGWWFAAAIGAEILSMGALAGLHRRLLRAGGLRVSVPSILSVLYISNALSSTVPVAGSELGAAYTYRRYKRFGAAKVTAAWILVMSGVISTVSLAVIVAVSATASGNVAAAAAGLAGTAVLAASIALALLAWHKASVRTRLRALAARCLRLSQRTVRRPVGDPDQLLSGVLGQITVLRLRRREWAATVNAASVNWLADVLCLVLALRAIGQPVPWALLIPAWAAGATATSLSVTPGGIGIVEAALTASLVAAGLRPGPALAAVLVYRAASFWLPLAGGWSLYLVQRQQIGAGGGDRASKPATLPAAGAGGGGGNRASKPVTLPAGARRCARRS